MRLVKKMLLFFGDGTKSITYSAITSLKQNATDEIVVIGSAVNDKIKKVQEQRGGIYKTFDDYMTKELWDEIEGKAISLVKDWPDIKIKDNKSFKEMFIYDGISLWWLVEPILVKPGKSINIMDILKLIGISKSIIAIEGPDKIVAINDGSIGSKVIGKVANIYKIPVEWITIKKSISVAIYSLLKKPCKPLKTIVRICAFGMKFIFRKYLYTINRFIYSSTVNQSNKPTILMALLHGRSARAYTGADGKRRIGDLYFGNLDEYLVNDPTKRVIVISPSTPKIWGRLSIVMEVKELLSRHLSYIPSEYYWNKNIMLKVISARKDFDGEWNKLKNSVRFKKSLKYDDIEISDLMENVFSTVLLSNFPSAILSIETMKSAIEKEKADIFLSADGISPFVYAAQMKNVPSIGVQHGIIRIPIIMLEHYHRKGEIWHSTSIDGLTKCPVQTKIAVWGEYFRDILVNGGNYIEESIVVTGCPRYDQLINADEIFSKENFCQQYNLNPDKKIILITAHMISTYEHIEAYISILRSLKQFSQVQVVIKPHHSHQSKKWHENILNEEKIKATVIPSNANTYEAIYACDVMVIVTSTTALEAAILDKLVVIVNLTNDPIYEPFIKSDAMLICTKKEDLIPTIKKALYNKEVVNEKLRDNRKKFVYEHAYIQDGQASMRVSDLIMQMVEKSKRGKNEN